MHIGSKDRLMIKVCIFLCVITMSALESVQKLNTTATGRNKNILILTIKT